MPESGWTGRRIALIAAASAAILTVSTVAVVAANSLTAAGHDRAARVAAEDPLPPIESDVLSESQAKARDRALRAAERAALLRRISGIEVPESLLIAPPGGVSIQTGTGREIDCAVVRCVALTFDDGPGGQTGELLDMLARADAVATWFPLGELIADNPDALRAIADAGHEIGNHTWSHPQLTRLSDRLIARQLTRSADFIEGTIGRRPTLVRPPYGSISRRVSRDLARLGAPAILWDVDPLDWKYRNSDRVYGSVMRQVRPGSIVLMHDIHPTTVAAVPRILRALTERGYTFVTVSELFGGSLHPGTAYTDRAEAYRPD